MRTAVSLLVLSLALVGCEAPPVKARLRVTPKTVKAQKRGLPPIDVQAPKRIETATFGLG